MPTFLGVELLLLLSGGSLKASSSYLNALCLLDSFFAPLGLVAPRDAENPESDEAAKAKEKRQQQPKQQKERQRMAFGIEGDGR